MINLRLNNSLKDGCWERASYILTIVPSLEKEPQKTVLLTHQMGSTQLPAIFLPCVSLPFGRFPFVGRTRAKCPTRWPNGARVAKTP